LRWPRSRIYGLLALLLVVPVDAHTKQLIRLGTHELPPYHMLEEGQIVGVIMDRVTCAMDRIGRPYEILLTSLPKVQLMTQNQELDGFFTASPNTARARYSTPSDPVNTKGLAWFTLPDVTIDPSSKADKVLARYSAKFGTSKWLKLHREGYNVVKKPRDAEALLDMLLKGDIDVALEYDMIFSHYIKARGLLDNDFRKIPVKRVPNMVHFSKTYLASNPLFLPRFNKFLMMCKAVEK
jgi:polar amino acid transport system substrate-binding protein